MHYLFKKIIMAFLTLYLALTAIFIGIRIAPGNPVEKILGPEATTEEIQKYEIQLGLDKSLTDQYLHYFSQILKGDLGESIFKKSPVVELIKTSFSPTLTLAFWSVTLSSLIGIFFGLMAGYFKGGFFDQLIRIFSLLGISVPIFSLAPMLILLFAIKLDFFPVSEWGEWKNVFLPVLTLVIPLSSIIMRVTRNRYLEDKNAPWITVLAAKGLSGRAIMVRILKVILPSIFNVISLQLSVVLAGTMITESIFDIPGMGSLLFEGIQNRDYNIVQGTIIYITVTYLTIYFAVDYLNGKIDPRIID